MFDLNKKLHSLAIATSFVFLGLASQSVQAADVSSGDGFENVVVSLNTDPTKDPEPACVALQIGMNLLSSPGGTPPADNVALFLTTGGVELINPDNSINNRSVPKPVCTTPDGIAVATLQDLIVGFEGLGGTIVVCPLCAVNRGITEPTAGEIANGTAIHNLFLNADKVITF